MRSNKYLGMILVLSLSCVGCTAIDDDVSISGIKIVSTRIRQPIDVALELNMPYDLSRTLSSSLGGPVSKFMMVAVGFVAFGSLVIGPIGSLLNFQLPR